MPDLDNGLTYPLNSDAANQIGSYIEELARDVRALYIADLQVNRPAAAKPGRLFRATDTGLMFWDTGSTWLQVNGGYLSTAAQRASLSPLVVGGRHYATDTGDHSTYLGGGNWSADFSESRAITAAGPNTATTGGAYLPYGTVTPRGPVTWSRTAISGTSNALLVPSATGRYRITALVTLVSSSGDATIRLSSAGATSDVAKIDTGSATLTSIRDLAVGEGFSLSAVAPGGATLRCQEAIVERLGW